MAAPYRSLKPLVWLFVHGVAEGVWVGVRLGTIDGALLGTLLLPVAGTVLGAAAGAVYGVLASLVCGPPISATLVVVAKRRHWPLGDAGAFERDVHLVVSVVVVIFAAAVFVFAAVVREFAALLVLVGVLPLPFLLRAPRRRLAGSYAEHSYSSYIAERDATLTG